MSSFIQQGKQAEYGESNCFGFLQVFLKEKTRTYQVSIDRLMMVRRGAAGGFNKYVRLFTGVIVS